MEERAPLILAPKAANRDCNCVLEGRRRLSYSHFRYEDGEEDEG